MAEKIFKVNEITKIDYQAPNKQTGLTVLAEIILPGEIQDSNYPDVTLTDPLGKGVYSGDFTPNIQGEWKAIIHINNGEGQVIKRYSVGGHNVHSVGEAVGGVNSAVSNIQSDVSDIQSTVDGVDTQLDTVETKIDNISTQVGSLDTPPMVS